MKKLYSAICLLFCLLFTRINAQTFQATVKAGSAGNAAILAIKPSADVVNRKLSTLTLCIGIPASALPKPTVSVKNNFNASISYDIQVSPAPENVDGKGMYHIYNLLGDGAQGGGTERTYLASGDNNMVEIELNGGPTGGASEILLVNIPGGGATGQTNLYVANQGIDATNLTAMFYGLGANNGVGGYGSTSFVPLGSVVLPVKFLSFYALKTGDDAKLNWTVENDEDNQFFDIERSTDGRTYTKFASVNAKANGKSVNTYDGADARLSSLNAKTIYYRIKQLDKSGTALFSPIRTLNVSATGSASLFPNPARSMSKLVVDAPVGGKASIVVRDATGKQAIQVNTNFVKGVNQIDLNVAALASGEYNVTITAEGVTQTLKLSKIN